MYIEISTIKINTTLSKLNTCTHKINSSNPSIISFFFSLQKDINKLLIKTVSKLVNTQNRKIHKT